MLFEPVFRIDRFLLLQIYIQLIEGNLDPIFIEGQLDLLNQIPAGAPVIVRGDPATDLQVHGAVSQVVYYDQVVLILQDGGCAASRFRQTSLASFRFAV